MVLCLAPRAVPAPVTKDMPALVPKTMAAATTDADLHLLALLNAGVQVPGGRTPDSSGESKSTSKSSESLVNTDQSDSSDHGSREGAEIVDWLFS